MIFLRYESFRGYLRLYPVNSALIALNLVMFIVLLFNGGSQNQETLVRFGAFLYGYNDPYGLAEPWRYVTSMFLHYGFEHLLFNMFSLLVFAPPLERLVGSALYAVFYLLSGIGGNVLSVIMDSKPYVMAVSVGASGAIYGVFGAFLFLATMRKHWLDEASRKTIYTMLIIGIVYSLLMRGVNLWAHIGGAIVGFVLLYALDRRVNRRLGRRP
ncbi:rhomboid family intramembrane serine protease [Paenibacillus cisolokensis]|uniref:rhomboid family intramembrane serine protease n=1 Tax=Paenibacillus TaxID=44249 RepID=UPI0007218A6B|nr:rhomboid family intramembrane serine protease [Paenibacillus sp. 32O-W]ALS28967.1 rhomboid family protein [Paenibacillus sp. 32O-W]